MLIAVLPATTSGTFSGMQLKERPGSPGPYAAPDEIAPRPVIRGGRFRVGTMVDGTRGEAAAGHLQRPEELNGQVDTGRAIDFASGQS